MEGSAVSVVFQVNPSQESSPNQRQLYTDKERQLHTDEERQLHTDKERQLYDDKERQLHTNEERQSYADKEVNGNEKLEQESRTKNDLLLVPVTDVYSNLPVKLLQGMSRLEFEGIKKRIDFWYTFSSFQSCIKI